MEIKEISDKVLTIVKKILEEGQIPPKTLDEDISELLDSIRFVTLVVEIENQFDIEIDEDDFEISKMDTINKISQIISKYVN